MDKRVSSRAIIIEDGKVLAIFRRKLIDGVLKEYYVIPGGGLEEGETLEENVTRELKEELGLDIEIIKFLKTSEYEKDIANYFLCKIKSGTPKIGGEELDRMNENNYYEPMYLDIDKIDEYDISEKDLIKSLK